MHTDATTKTANDQVIWEMSNITKMKMMNIIFYARFVWNFLLDMCARWFNKDRDYIYGDMHMYILQSISMERQEWNIFAFYPPHLYVSLEVNQLSDTERDRFCLVNRGCTPKHSLRFKLNVHRIRDEFCCGFLRYSYSSYIYHRAYLLI